MSQYGGASGMLAHLIWLGTGHEEGRDQAGVRILDPGRANCQAHFQQTSVAKHAPLPQEDIFWGGFIGPVPRWGEHLNQQSL